MSLGLMVLLSIFFSSLAGTQASYWTSVKTGDFLGAHDSTNVWKSDKSTASSVVHDDTYAQVRHWVVAKSNGFSTGYSRITTIFATAKLGSSGGYDGTSGTTYRASVSFDIGAHLEGPNQYVKVTVRLTYLGGNSKVIASSNYITFSTTDVHGTYNLITPGFTLDVSRTLYVELEVYTYTRSAWYQPDASVNMYNNGQSSFPGEYEYEMNLNNFQIQKFVSSIQE